MLSCQGGLLRLRSPPVTAVLHEEMSLGYDIPRIVTLTCTYKYTHKNRSCRKFAGGEIVFNFPVNLLLKMQPFYFLL